MPADIKGILDSIIDGANNKFPNDVNSTMHQNMGVKTPETFDAGKFREKLSLYVLKDIISAMMHDETKDLDGMIDQSIINHIRDCYGCGCYDYLCKSRDKLNSPILSDIIQEIDQKTMQIKSKVVDRQDDAFTADAEDLKDELPKIENYAELKKRLRETVSNKVVEDVANAVTQFTNAPTFDNLDDELAKRKTEEEIPLEAEDTTNESSILKITSTIVSEGYQYGKQIDTKDAMEAAIVEYCICEMDYLFKMDITMEHRRDWDTGHKVLQEGFFDIFKKWKKPASKDPDKGYIVLDLNPPVHLFLTDDDEISTSHNEGYWYPKGITPQFHLIAEQESTDPTELCAMVGTYDDTGEFVVVFRDTVDEIHVYSLETKSAEDVLKKFHDGIHLSTEKEDIGDES